MRFVADVHVHSRYARATSKQLDPENLHKWGCLKGLTVVGTGDFTHPAWLAELKEKLEPAPEGLYRLKPGLPEPAVPELPPSCRGEVRFILSSEISLIYKRDDRTRKVHHVVLMPDFEAVERLNTRLAQIGNIESDGRPILGLDSRDLLEICLQACEDVLFIPAHIWTPHFAALGSASGFDSLEACFGDLLPHIHAVETGLSSDPPMNWRLSALDQYAIVSNSDAHSAQKLAREGTCFDTDLSFNGISSALKTRDPGQHLGTIEFYPEEGKYHYDGHRKCEICWKPAQTLGAGGLCPVCGKKLTIGVLHQVEALADRPEGAEPEAARGYESLVPLPEVIGSALSVGPASKKVQGVYHRLLRELGPELRILREVPVEDIDRCGEPLVAEGVRRMRAGEVDIQPGYDGVYGQIRVFSGSDRTASTGQASLFDLQESPLEASEDPKGAVDAAPTPAPVSLEGESGPAVARDSLVRDGECAHSAWMEGLDGAQAEAVCARPGPVVVIAGPGTGKTRVLTRRVAHLVREQGVLPGAILAVTFTNRAAEEMRRRVEVLLPDAPGLGDLTLGTFHSVALNLLEEYGTDGSRAVVDQVEARDILADVITEAGVSVRGAAAESEISVAKANGIGPGEMAGDEDIRRVYEAYQERLRAYGVRDYDDILLDLVRLLEGEPTVLTEIQDRFRHVLVDEFQDVNAVQYRLVRLVAAGGDGLFVIGDPNQAIYGFRGASSAFFGVLAHDYSAARTAILETTYRSTENLIRTAAGVMDGHERSAGVRLASARGEVSRVRLLSVPSETAEGIAVVREIGRMVGGADMLQFDDREDAYSEVARSFGDFGVLFRTGRQAEVLETCFLQEGLPYRVVGQKGFLEAESVRQALAFFRYALRPGGDLRFLNALALPSFHPGRETLSRLRRRVGEALLSDISPDEMPAPAREKTVALRKAAERYRKLAASSSPEDLLRQWLTEYELESDLHYERLLRVAAYAPTMDWVLNRVLLGQDADHERSGGEGPRPSEAVSLMTLHAAKGLEFPVVFICGVEDGLIPFRERETDLDEERRLFYVGLTRARDEVILLCARSRLRYGQRIHPEISPFLRDIPSDLLAEEQVRPGRLKRAEQLSLW